MTPPAPASQVRHGNTADRPSRRTGRAGRVGRAGRTAGRSLSAVLLVSLSTAVAVLAPMPYLTRTLDDLAAGGTGLAEHYATQPAALQASLLVHAAAGGLALLLTTVQFLAPLRRRAVRVHRALGYATVAAIAVSATAGLVIAQVSYAGLVGTAGFSALALLWGTAAARTAMAARAGAMAQHRAWALRTAAFSGAAVTLRLWLGVLIAAQQPGSDADAQEAFDRAYALVPFLCWVPNLLVAEWLIRRRR